MLNQTPLIPIDEVKTHLKNDRLKQLNHRIPAELKDRFNAIIDSFKDSAGPESNMTGSEVVTHLINCFCAHGLPIFRYHDECDYIHVDLVGELINKNTDLRYENGELRTTVKNLKKKLKAAGIK